VGGLGFVVDAGILTALVNGLGHGHYVSRAASFSVAVTVTWLINRRWVFDAGEASGKEYSGYFVVQLIGATINLGVYALVIEMIPSFAALPVIPLAVGAAVALLANFFLVRQFVYKEAAS
jgi:putative flippase GtrA